MAYKFQLGAAQLSGALRQEGTVIAEEKLTVLADGAEITGAVDMSSTLDVVGNAQFDADLNADGAVSLAAAGTSTTVRGDFDAAEAVGLAAAGLATSVRGTLSVAEIATFSDVVSASAGAEMGSIMPAAATDDLGASSDRWRALYANDLDVAGAVNAAELSGALEYGLDAQSDGGLSIDNRYDNTVDSEISLKNVANFSDDAILRWDESNNQFEDSIMTDDGSVIVVAGALSASGDLDIDSNAQIDGNLTAEGTVRLAVAGTSTTARGTFFVNEKATMRGEVQLGDASSDFIDFQGEVSSSIIPSGSGQFDLGSSGNPWENIYVNNIVGADLALDIDQGTSFAAGVDVLFADGNATLPACADGKLIRIKNVKQPAGAITLTRAGSDTIEDGSSTTIELETQGAAVSLIGSGSNWMIF